MKALEMKLFCKFKGKFCNFSLTKEFLIDFYHLKALENKEFSKIELKISDVFKILSNFLTFLDIFSKTLIFSGLFLISDFF